MFDLKLTIKPFDGYEEKWPEFCSYIATLTELTKYNPLGPFVTTPTNTAQSSNLRAILLQLCKKQADDFFKNKPQYKDQGFEMWADLVKEYAPTGKTSIFLNYISLFTI